MSKKDLNEKEADNSINSPPPPAQEQDKENIGYNCPECSSLIEILSIKEDNLEFKCVSNENHCNTLKINNYLEKMKQYIDKKNLNDKCEKHSKEYRVYCFDCKCHLCKECLKTKIHKKHQRVLIEEEEQPTEEELNIIKNKIEYYKDKIKNIKENKINQFKNELKNNKIKENKRTKQIIKVNKIKKIKELKSNKDKYIDDINEIKRKYETEKKLRKIKYETDNNNINNKYKIIYNKEIILNKNKIKELNIIYNKNIDNIKNDKEINELLNLKRLNELIINTYNICNNNYYYCININNIINTNKNENEDNNIPKKI